MIRQFSLTMFVFFCFTITPHAQEAQQWSLQQCIQYAHENNITIKRQELNTQNRENQLKQAKRDLLPDANANSGYNISFGQSPVQQGSDYVYVDKTSRSFNIGASSNTSLFAGFRKQNEIKRANSDFLASVEMSQKTKNDIALQITSQYLQILFNRELLAVAEQQQETSQMQVERTKKLVDAGSQAMGSYLEIKSQAAKEALNVTQQENSLMLAKLNLAQLLDLEVPDNFDIETPDIPAIQLFQQDAPNAIYMTSLDIMPQIKQSNYNVERSQYQYKVAKGGLFPSLNFNAGVSSNANWVSGVDTESFADQLKNRRQSYLGLSLNIPIFNKLQARTSISNAQLGIRDAQLQLENEKLTLRKDIQQAYADARAAYKNYLASEEAVNSYAESFRYTEKKFNVGLVNSVDYNVAKTDYTRAQSDLLQAKYEYILRTKILDFYKGIPIEL
jgi:outer membrane protein